MSERRVLVVEDDPGIRLLVEHVARRAGFAVTSASQGAEAILALQGPEHFCVVILDLMMPKVSGYDVVGHIRDNQPTVPVIVATAVVRNLDWSRLDSSIVRTVLTKPFDVDQLREALNVVCPDEHSAG
jgi:CheY-like chemotaxis protein